MPATTLTKHGQNSMVMVAAFSVAAVLVIATGVHAYWQVGKKKQSPFLLDK
jgi:hypothetical protein